MITVGIILILLLVILALILCGQLIKLRELQDKLALQAKLIDKISANAKVISEDISDIKKNVYHCKQQGGVLKRVYATIANVDNNLTLIFKKLADNSSKAKEIQYPIKRKHGKKF
jgi:hypothetical protein